jgi:hypothetical protein
MGQEVGAKWAPQEELVQVPSVVVEQGEAQVASMSMEWGGAASTSGSSRGSLDWDAVCCGTVDVNHHPVGNPKRKV